MATTPRNIRFDDDLYKEIKAISKRPLTAAYHIQEACRQYLETKTQPVKSVKPEKPSGLIDDDLSDLFDQVWDVYGKKGNKKTSKSKYLKLSEANRDLMAHHILRYINSTPDKQYRKNLETYINQECWNDEIVQSKAPQKAADSIELLTDRSWADDLMGGGNAIEHEFYK